MLRYTYQIESDYCHFSQWTYLLLGKEQSHVDLDSNWYAFLSQFSYIIEK